MSFAPALEALLLFLKKVEARSAISAEARHALLDLPVRPRQFQAHREIVQCGETADHACLVSAGFVARIVELEDGRRQNVSLHLAGDMVDLCSLVLPAVPAPLVALTAATVFEIAHSALRDLAFRHPSIAAAFWRECVVDGAIVTTRLVSVGRRDARGRLAHLLCEMAVRSNHIGRYMAGRFAFPITQEQIADSLGLTAVHVNRTLQGLRADGLVQVSQGEVFIPDWHDLVRAGEFDPAYLHLDITSGPAAKASTV